MHDNYSLEREDSQLNSFKTLVEARMNEINKIQYQEMSAPQRLRQNQLIVQEKDYVLEYCDEMSEQKKKSLEKYFKGHDESKSKRNQ